MRITHVLVGLAFASSLAACGPETRTVTLSADPNAGSAGAHGTAVLTDVSGKTQVKISLTEGSDTGSQAAHIHQGTCTSLGAAAYPLNNVVNGQSDTTIDVDLDALKGGNYAINVHLSTDINKYVACGNIP